MALCSIDAQNQHIVNQYALLALIPKKPIVCFKCGQTGHKSFQCKTEQKINELFSDDPGLKQKLHALLIRDHSEEEDGNYYSESQSESEYKSSPITTINVITNKS